MSLTIQIDPYMRSRLNHKTTFDIICGLLGPWALMVPNGVNLKDHILKCYDQSAGTPWEIKGDESRIDDNYFYLYETADGEKDPPLPPMVIFQYDDEIMLVYEHAIVAFVGGNDVTTFYRLD